MTIDELKAAGYEVTILPWGVQVEDTALRGKVLDAVYLPIALSDDEMKELTK